MLESRVSVLHQLEICLLLNIVEHHFNDSPRSEPACVSIACLDALFSIYEVKEVQDTPICLSWIIGINLYEEVRWVQPLCLSSSLAQPLKNQKGPRT